MQTITPEFLDELIDFAPGDSDSSKSIGELQSAGTVAAFNMLALNGCAYLADEVGMGKTYVALGVMSILRYLKPDARVVVIAPRQNIQEKWKKELTNFVRNNWRFIGNRVKSLNGTPVWDPVVCSNLPMFAHEALLNQDRDFFLRMTSFSLAARQREDREKARDVLLKSIPWLSKDQVDVREHTTFLDSYSVALNGAIPHADLVIVDEAHNLKHGFGDNVSNRNRVMGMAFGHETGFAHQRHWFEKKADHVLLLSATPFEDDYGAIKRQLDVFGFGDAKLRLPNTDDALNVESLALADAEVPPEYKRDVVKRLMIRRTAGIMIDDEKYTKNMYRREWRRGGLKTHDQPETISDGRTKLIVALMQKKITEILQSEKFNNSFQIGMLSSFESFAQSVNTAIRQKEQDGAFDDIDQQRQLSQEERDGIDSNAISQIASSFEELFGQKLPHPKLDRTAEYLAEVFDHTEKALVFVRRVATVGELASKLNDRFNEWVQRRMREGLPELNHELQQIFDRYREERRQKTTHNAMLVDRAAQELDPGEQSDAIEQLGDLTWEDDAGGFASFFEWFFRGEGPPGTLSGAAFNRNRFLSSASIYATFFQDNYAADLLQVPGARVIDLLCARLDSNREDCVAQLRNLAYGYFHERSKQQEGYPRLYVYESYQVAALRLIAEGLDNLADHAKVILQERFADATLGAEHVVPERYPNAEEFLSTATVFTELRMDDDLRSQLWPQDRSTDFRVRFRQREQRRELFSAVARLGAAYIDLYLLAIKQIGSFELRQTERETDAVQTLAQRYVELLRQQSAQSGLNAYFELSRTAATFDTLISVNFPDIEQQELAGLGRYFGSVLGHQVPIGEVSGQINQRLVKQFRMPGFPLVLISTDVLQEGEDLHTFCKNILHYGIAWTPSAIEQRTGRIDRIGGLVQRELDGKASKPSDSELIQVFYPHLRDTVELLQVRRVLRKLNAFIELMHDDVTRPTVEESSLNMNTAVGQEYEDVPQYSERLKSAFDIDERWLDGKLGARDVTRPNWDVHRDCLTDALVAIANSYEIEWEKLQRTNHEFSGKLLLRKGHRQELQGGGVLTDEYHPFVLRLASNIADDRTLLQCESPVGDMDLESNGSKNIDTLAKLARTQRSLKVCIEPRISKALDRVFVRQEILFDPNVTERDDVVHLFESVVPIAAQMHDNWSASKV